MVATRGHRANAKTCASCWQSKPRNEFPHVTPTNQCDHEVKTCTDCIRTWIATKLETVYQPNSAIQCPDCDIYFVGTHIFKNATRETNLRYVTRSQRITKSMQPDSLWCPNPDCDFSIQLTPAAVNSKVGTCRKCGAKACVTCDRPYHEGETCEQYAARNMARLVEEKVAGRMLESLKASGAIKTCPNCDVAIEKLPKTADTIRCSRCQYYFNWSTA